MKLPKDQGSRMTFDVKIFHRGGLIASMLLAVTAATALGAAEVLTLPADNDGVVLRYGLFVPRGSDGKFPLIVDASPVAVGLELDVGKIGYYDLDKATFAVLRLPPFGRGGGQWSPFGERDNLQVIRHVMKSHPIDPDRVYLLGATQGFAGNGYGAKKLQYGTLSLAYHQPDLFAAVTIGAADIRTDAYRATWLGHWHQYQLQYAFPLRLREMPILWADNLLGTPTWLTIAGNGRREMQLYHEMDKHAPVKLKLLLAPSVKDQPLPDEVVRKQIVWLLDHRIQRRPRRVVIATNTLKHSRNRWVRIDALSEVNRFCRLEARLTGDGRLKVRGAGFTGFTLTGLKALTEGRKSLNVDIEHQLLKVTPSDELSFRLDGEKWKLGRASTGEPAKSAEMTDTIIDAFREPYILVPGAGDAKLRRLATDTLQAIQNSGRTTPIDLSPVPIKTDAEITSADMARANLILFGDERSNSIIAKINPRLPIRLTGGAIISGKRTFRYDNQGLMMVYPNPLAPARKVVIVTAAIHEGYFLTDKRFAKAAFPANLPGHGFPMLGDWIIFRRNGKGLAKKGRANKGLDNAVIEGGFFDAEWKLARGPYYFFNKNFVKQGGSR